ncbi:MAG TPA: hypothetical protein VL485_02810 [Ktedonobacteraceae bacterium]|nr:hypothetical protein [Ktedonobacteraceae bacterium]
MDELIQRLSEGKHPVIVGGLQPTLKDLKRRILEMKYVFIKFTDTRGGTDLGVVVDTEATRLDAADFECGTGIIHIEGTLILNYTKVCCIADIDLATFKGTGHLYQLALK